MALDPSALPEEVLSFLGEYHLATLTTMRLNGTPHVVPVGFSYEPATQLARVITFTSSRKARNLLDQGAGSRAVLCQLDGPRWLSLEGSAVVTNDPDRVAEGVRGYAERYRRPSERDDRVVIEISVDRILGRG